MNDSVAAIVGAFFIIGISVGIITVIAISVLRADRRGDPADPPAYRPPGPGGPSSAPDWDDAGPGDRARWPGDGNNAFSGR